MELKSSYLVLSIIFYIPPTVMLGGLKSYLINKPGSCMARQGEEHKGEERKEQEEGGTAHPRLGVHPSLESVCAVITVSNR